MSIIKWMKSSKFSKRNFDFGNEFPQFESVVQVLNDSWLNGKPHWTQMLKKCHLDKRHMWPGQAKGTYRSKESIFTFLSIPMEKVRSF